ncbi:putative Zinc finger protein SWIM domain-containing protein, partial [Operophtera brumata]
EVAQCRWQDVGAGEASASSSGNSCSGADACAGSCERVKLSLVLAHMDAGSYSRCWTGWTLEAIWCVYECLADACLAPDDQRASPRLHTAYLDEEPNTGLPPRYQHVPVAGSKNPEETYLALALEAALLGLGVQRMLPSGLYAQERYCKQRVEGEAASVVCARVARALLAGGPASCLGAQVHPRAAPAHTFARFLFLTLLPTDPELAYRVGLRAMRLPMVEEAYALDGAASGAGAAGGGAGAWHTLQHAEQQQAALASALLGATDDVIICQLAEKRDGPVAGPVAAAAMSHATALRLGLSFEQQEKLSACARTLALQCAAKDPPGCALSALSVCEGSAGAFEAACAAVGGAAARGALASSQLFAVARYMEQRGQPARAMRLATLAMRNLHLHYNQ